jgi:hypothetical protein
MVPLGRAQVPEVRGTLELTDDALVFTEHRGGMETRFPYDAMRRARRVRGSPVLMVTSESNGVREQTAFYFAQPPPLAPPDPADESLPGSAISGRPAGPFGAIRRSSKRRHQRTNITYLASASSGKKQEIREWVAEITERIGRPGRA